MTLSRSKGKLREQSPRSDELADPVAAPPEAVARRSDGTVAGPEAAKLLGRKGGLRKAQNREKAAFWARRLGLARFMSEVPVDKNVAEVVRESEAWFAQTLDELVKDVGGGELNTIVTTLVELAAWQRAYAIWLYSAASKSPWAWDRDEEAKPSVRPATKLLEVANRLVEGFRVTALAAWDVAAKSAKVRPPNGGALPPWMQMVDADDAAKGAKKP